MMFDIVLKFDIITKQKRRIYGKNRKIIKRI